jgi:hypothetical protein
MVCWFTPRAKKNIKNISPSGIAEASRPRLYVKISRCEFWMKQVSFLSYVILEEGIFVGSSRTRNVLSLDTPASVTNSRIFLGLVG